YFSAHSFPSMACGVSTSVSGTLPMSCNNPALLRSEEHTSELQSRENLVCRLLLEKKKSLRCRTADGRKARTIEGGRPGRPTCGLAQAAWTAWTTESHRHLGSRWRSYTPDALWPRC